MSDNAEMSMIYASPICSIQTPEGPKCGIIKEPLIPRHIPIEGTKTTHIDYIEMSSGTPRYFYGTTILKPHIGHIGYTMSPD